MLLFDAASYAHTAHPRAPRQHHPARRVTSGPRDVVCLVRRYAKDCAAVDVLGCSRCILRRMRAILVASESAWMLP